MTYQLSKEEISLLERGYYEYNNALSNMVFLLSHYIKENDDFIKSDLFLKQTDFLIEKYIQKYIFETGVLAIAFKNDLPTQYFIDQNYCIHTKQ